MNKIIINNNKPEINLLIKTVDNNYESQTFLIDTGFTGSIIFILRTKKILQKFNFYNIKELKERYVVLPNGKNVKTFSASIYVEVNKKAEYVEVLLIDGENDQNPIIGIDFLRQHKKRLNLDFGNEVFELV